MHLEIAAAVNFLIKILSLRKRMKTDQLETLGTHLSSLLSDRYRGHWYPDAPSRGQAYRCIRINSWQYVDESLLKACAQCNLEYTKLGLPEEITLWIDPYEVCGRFGEHTKYFTIAKFPKEVVVREPVQTIIERETSDYSSGSVSSGSVSESSSDDEITSKDDNTGIQSTQDSDAPRRLWTSNIEATHRKSKGFFGQGVNEDLRKNWWGVDSSQREAFSNGEPTHSSFGVQTLP
ncbi:protein BTG3-like [Spea bombifrons]|uniref:protein BTG3-like n=1 Tax=Spea bombifrons TaxID=233779 RepID=UPI00234A9EA5|nr:protein BTG3-like [Spea bombifrons]